MRASFPTNDAHLSLVPRDPPPFVSPALFPTIRRKRRDGRGRNGVKQARQGVYTRFIHGVYPINLNAMDGYLGGRKIRKVREMKVFAGRVIDRDSYIGRLKTEFLCKFVQRTIISSGEQRERFVDPIILSF